MPELFRPPIEDEKYHSLLEKISKDLVPLMATYPWIKGIGLVGGMTQLPLKSILSDNSNVPLSELLEVGDIDVFAIIDLPHSPIDIENYPDSLKGLTALQRMIEEQAQSEGTTLCWAQHPLNTQLNVSIEYHLSKGEKAFASLVSTMADLMIVSNPDLPGFPDVSEEVKRINDYLISRLVEDNKENLIPNIYKRIRRQMREVYSTSLYKRVNQVLTLGGHISNAVERDLDDYATKLIDAKLSLLEP